MKKIDTFLVTYGVAPYLIFWAAFHVNPLHPMLMLLEFAVMLYPLAYVETLVHEVGHVVAGFVYGVPITEIRVGGGPVVTLWKSQRTTVKAGPYPGIGHVDFRMLPLSRRARIVMYASGVGATRRCTAGRMVPDPGRHDVVADRNDAVISFRDPGQSASPRARRKGRMERRGRNPRPCPIWSLNGYGSPT
ncbi:hypothetical protein Bsp3421_000117 (plasmid) [Burkholderia sp. FERM BP-3421]|uniref:hypothetical protein n=1 Tax=Burkholderia sp. FERM BP-3421 TaxID=1494466 RepID=UPI00236086F7|nr:hypothetical protein [Burkholderia sp. FERM BP-3421]WDD90292.1 hypothetical protein Bsp3421_000117 [Burkholderia sp. FERM BP-3421]